MAIWLYLKEIAMILNYTFILFHDLIEIKSLNWISLYLLANLSLMYYSITLIYITFHSYLK